ncbi:hypothetical protein PsYK624_077800 [Phanerochaete sordida]|uniref:Uncharacterized protein n=1 Tax=Phanerochaete sordida TaxID=48140 RepID=A0A9P3LDU8_9APHY|nr:hypothetical protein PsYK624_077800 [Phanerochaete sordida]
MKYIAILAAFAATALAQGINIAAPAANSQVYRGEWITVEVDKEQPTAPTTEVALVLSMARCPSSGCSAGSLGQILYNGPYNPQDEHDGKLPYQNFSVPVPTSFSVGDQVALIATRFNLVGSGPYPNIDQRVTPLTVVKGYLDN